MSANAALIFNFNEERSARAARETDTRPRISLADALARIERAGAWLASKQLCVLGFTGSTLSSPVMIIAAHPEAWILFSGRTDRLGFKQEGALRYEVWEGLDRINQVRVRWQEVVACA